MFTPSEWRQTTLTCRAPHAAHMHAMYRPSYDSRTSIAPVVCHRDYAMIHRFNTKVNKMQIKCWWIIIKTQIFKVVKSANRCERTEENAWKIPTCDEWTLQHNLTSRQLWRNGNEQEVYPPYMIETHFLQNAKQTRSNLNTTFNDRLTMPSNECVNASLKNTRWAKHKQTSDTAKYRSTVR